MKSQSLKRRFPQRLYDSTPNNASVFTRLELSIQAWSWTGLGWNQYTGKGFWPQKRSITASNSKCQALLLNTMGNRLNWGVGGSIGLVWCNCRCSEALLFSPALSSRVHGDWLRETAARRELLPINTISDQALFKWRLATDLFFSFANLALRLVNYLLAIKCKWKREENKKKNTFKLPFLIFHYGAVFDRTTGASATSSRCVYGCGGIILWSDSEPSFQPWMLKFPNSTEMQHSFQTTKQNRDKALWETPPFAPPRSRDSQLFLFILFVWLIFSNCCWSKGWKKSPRKQSESGSENGMRMRNHHKGGKRRRRH